MSCPNVGRFSWSFSILNRRKKKYLQIEKQNIDINEMSNQINSFKQVKNVIFFVDSYF